MWARRLALAAPNTNIVHLSVQDSVVRTFQEQAACQGRRNPIAELTRLRGRSWGIRCALLNHGAIRSRRARQHLPWMAQAFVHKRRWPLVVDLQADSITEAIDLRGHRDERGPGGRSAKERGGVL